MKIGFIGGGKFAYTLMSFIEKIPAFEIVIIADVFRDAPAMKHAMENKIRTSTNIMDVINHPEIECLIEVTGKRGEVMDKISANLSDKVIFIDTDIASVMFTIFSKIIENEFQNLEESFMANIKDIENAISDFATITKSIDILSINASIEAARAGDAGKGFAVVASSIKDLVKNSRDTLQYVKSVLEKLTLVHKDMQEIRSTMNEDEAE